MPNRRLLCVVVLLLAPVAALAGSIPSYVDYLATWQNQAWTIDQDRYGYGLPDWSPDNLRLTIPNRPVPIWIKELWIEVVYSSAVFRPEDPGFFNVTTSGGSIVHPVSVTKLGDFVSVLWKYIIIPQPPFEIVDFGSPAYHDLLNIDRVSVGTFCEVPLPLAAWGGVGLLGALAMRRRAGAGA